MVRSHMGRMENYTIAKSFYVGKYSGSQLMGRARRKWIDTLKNCLKKKGLDVRQAKRMVHDKNVWGRFARGNALGVGRVMNP